MQQRRLAVATNVQAPAEPLNSPVLAESPREGPVKETSKISIQYNPVSGRKQLNTYEIVKELGRGEFGRVKLGYDRDRDMYVAIKLLNRKDKPRLGKPQGSTTAEKVHREIAILKKCCHPNVVRLLEVLDDESSRKVYLVLEYCAKGELEWQCSAGGPRLSREEARGVARNVASGLEYLHANGIIHRDIKPANLLISAEDVVKISDFGVSFAVSGQTGTELELAKTAGTPAFFAPELCVPTEFNSQGERVTPPVSEKVDVWAFGVTLYCLLYGELPFEAENEYELFSVITQSAPQLEARDSDLVLANDLLRQLLAKDPAARPSMADAKQHPWFVQNLSAHERQIFLRRCPSEQIKVSSEEVDDAVQGVSIRNLIKHGLSRIAEHMKPRSRSRASSTTTLNTMARPRRLLQSQSFDVSPLSTKSSSSKSSNVQSGPSNATLRALEHRDDLSITSDTDHSLSSSRHSRVLYPGESDSLHPESSTSRRSSRSSRVRGRILHSKTSLDNSSLISQSSASSSSDEELMIVVGRDRARSFARNALAQEVRGSASSQ